jgi:hypothetical protein
LPIVFWTGLVCAPRRHCSGFRKKAANNRLKSSHELNRNEHSEASAANPQSAIRLVRHGVSHGGKPQLAATPRLYPAAIGPFIPFFHRA